MIQILTLLGAFGVGIVLSFLGAVKLALAKNLKIDDAKVGGLISALMFSCIVGVLIAGPLVDSLGLKPVIVFGFSLCGVCVLLIANARQRGKRSWTDSGVRIRGLSSGSGYPLRDLGWLGRFGSETWMVMELWTFC